MSQTDGAVQTDGQEPAQRRRRLGLLARAPLEMLEEALAPFAGPRPQWLRAPETGLVMAQGRAGGSGARFNLGEVAVTRCALRPDPASSPCRAVGVAYVLGRSHRHAELAALADALMGDPECRAAWQDELLARIASSLARREAERAARAQATRVEFFTVARETAGAGDGEASE